VIHPSIDPLSPKNEELSAEVVHAVLRASGMLGRAVAATSAVFARHDGTPGRVEHRAQVAEDEPIPDGAPVVVQISRWDALKDPLGVIAGFVDHVPPRTGAHLIYAGPAVEAVADDPEGLRVLQDSIAFRAQLPEDARRRVHLATLPMVDVNENAIIVNALQRHATVVTQKSLAEGFGLTVSEAMWKARPVVASRIGGIEEQIVHGETGMLVDDPRDLAAFGAAITSLLENPEEAARIGARARERVRDRFTSVRNLLDYAALIERLVGAPPHAESRRAAVAG
jgi:trehalose synthase